MMPVDSAADVHDPTADPAVDPDDISECSDLEAQLNLSIQLQMASILSFAYIWSFGAFIPFRYMFSRVIFTLITNLHCTYHIFLGIITHAPSSI